MMRGSRRGCVRLRVRFSGQILLTSVTNQYKLYSLCICSFALVLHKSTFYPTITIFNNVNDMSNCDDLYKLNDVFVLQKQFLTVL